MACIACIVEIICIRYKKCKKKVCYVWLKYVVFFGCILSVFYSWHCVRRGTVRNKKKTLRLSVFPTRFMGFLFSTSLLYLLYSMYTIYVYLKLFVSNGSRNVERATRNLQCDLFRSTFFYPCSPFWIGY